MYKNDIIDFSKDQIITIPIKDINIKDKVERRYGDLSKWFRVGDSIEFDDSAVTFISIKDSSTILECFKTIKLSVVRDGVEVNLSKEPFHCVSMINKCIMSFFVLGA